MKITRSAPSVQEIGFPQTCFPQSLFKHVRTFGGTRLVYNNVSQQRLAHMVPKHICTHQSTRQFWLCATIKCSLLQFRVIATRQIDKYITSFEHRGRLHFYLFWSCIYHGYTTVIPWWFLPFPSLSNRPQLLQALP